MTFIGPRDPARRHVGRASVGVAVTLVALSVLGTHAATTGFLLGNDSVAVPQQSLLAWMWGAGTAPPRSVPQDAVVAVIDDLLPGWLLQRAVVLGGLLLLGLGVARLLDGHGRLAQVCAATTALWSTYVFERMGMGHWGLLLAVAVLPWVLMSAADARAGRRGGVARTMLWGASGSLVPSGGLLQVLAVLTVVAWPGSRRGRSALGCVAGILALQAVWVVPGLMHPGTAGEAGVFGLRAEGPAGPVLTALGTGGLWNSAVMPASRAGGMAVLAPVMLLAVAAMGARDLRGMRAVVTGPLVLLACTGLVWAMLTGVPTAAGLVSAVEALPGGGLLRDGQKWLAPWLILLSACAGLGLARLSGWLLRHRAGGSAIALAVVVPLVLLPDVVLGGWSRFQPVHYPGDWGRVREILGEQSDTGQVLSWPWSTFRAYDWNRGRTSLDPATRFFPRTVVTDTRLLVDGADGLVTVPSDDTQSVAVGQALVAPDPAGRLAELGVQWILLQTGQPATPGYTEELPAALQAASHAVVTTPTLELRRLDLTTADVESTAQPAFVFIWLAWVLVVLASVGSLVRDYGQSRHARADASADAGSAVQDGRS